MSPYPAYHGPTQPVFLMRAVQAKGLCAYIREVRRRPGKEPPELSLGCVGGVLAARRWEGLNGAGAWVHKVAGHHAAESATHHLQPYEPSYHFSKKALVVLLDHANGHPRQVFNRFHFYSVYKVLAFL